MATVVPEGWYADPTMPWVAWRWDGREWTGECFRGGRRTGSPRPKLPPGPDHQVDVLTSETLGLHVRPGVVPFVVGAVAAALGFAAGEAVVALVAAVVALYGFVLLAHEQARRHAEAERAFTGTRLRHTRGRTVTAG